MYAPVTRSDWALLPRVSSQFVAQNRAKLELWLDGLRAENCPVVAISRKAPRLIELGVEEGLVASSILARTVSERALAFPSSTIDSTRKLVVCDDVLIHGSTFSKVLKGARDVVASLGDEAYDVHGSVFAVDSQAPSWAVDLLDSWGTMQPHHSLSAFINAEISAFGTLGKPYDIDHPIVYLDIEADSFETPDEQYTFLSPLSSRGYTTWRSFISSSCTGESWPTHNFLLQVDGDLINKKVRCYVNPLKRELALSAICLPAYRISEYHANLRSIHGQLADIWELASDSAVSLSHKTSETKELVYRSLVTIGNYLLEFGLLLEALNKLHFSDLSRVGVLQNPRVSTLDLQYLIGPSLASTITPKLNDLLSETYTSRASSWVISDVDGSEPYQILPDNYRERYQELLSQLLEPASTVSDALGRVFFAQHAAIERPSRSEQPHNESRLDFGISLRALVDSVDRCKSIPQSKRNDQIVFHKALDELIDSGVIVPRYLSKTLDENSIWSRLFRVGEGNPACREHIAAHCCRVLQRKLPQHGGMAYIPSMVYEKFVVLCLEFLNIYSDSALANTTQLSRGFHLLGARPRVEYSDAPHLDNWMVDWAVSDGILRKTDLQPEEITAEEQKKFWHSPHTYSLTEDASDLYRDDEVPLEPNRKAGIRRLATWLADYRSPDKLKILTADFLPAITSLESENTLRKALRAELSNWCFHTYVGWKGILSLLRKVQRANDVTLLRKPAVKQQLGRWHNWCKQAKEKIELHERLPSLIELADRMWSIEDGSEASEAWHELIRGELLTRRKERDPSLRHLVASVEVAYAVSHLFTQVTKESVGGLNFDMELEKCARSFVSHSDCLALDSSLLNEALNQVASGVADNNTMVLTESLLTVGSYVSSIVVTALEAFDIKPSLLDFTLEEESLYFVSWDVRDSSQTEGLQGLTDHIIQASKAVYQFYRNKIREFPVSSLDDGKYLLCTSFGTAMEIVKTFNDHVERVADGKSLRFSIDNTSDSSLFKNIHLGSRWGRAFQSQARVLGYFKEIQANPETLVDAVTSRPMGADKQVSVPNSSYLLVSEVAFRKAKEENRSDLLRSLVELPGLYKPRYYGSYGRKVYLKIL